MFPLAIVAFVSAAGILFSFQGAGAQGSDQSAPDQSSGSVPASTAPPLISPAPPTPAPSGTTSNTPSNTPLPPSNYNYPSVALPSDPASLAEGQSLFVDNCSTCHGITATGAGVVNKNKYDTAPNLVGLGPATVDFWLSTGRMPLASFSAEAIEKAPRFSRAETLDIVAYVASLAPGAGAPIPDVQIGQGDLAQGADIFTVNCAGCHVITGVGDALANSTFAPSLMPATPTQIGEAIRTGPGNMPIFDISQISPTQLNSLAAYVKYLRRPNDSGGAGLGHVGPVAEGFIALLIGVGGLLLVAYWIGDRA